MWDDWWVRPDRYLLGDVCMPTYTCAHTYRSKMSNSGRSVGWRPLLARQQEALGSVLCAQMVCHCQIA